MSERSRVRTPYRTLVISPSRLLLLKYIGIFKISSHSLHYVYHTNAGLAQVAPSLRVGGKQKLLTSGRGQSAGLLTRRFAVRVRGSAKSPIHKVERQSASESVRGARLSSISPVATRLIDYMKSRFILVCLLC